MKSVTTAKVSQKHTWQIAPFQPIVIYLFTVKLLSLGPIPKYINNNKKIDE